MKKERYFYLDIIRCLACFLVVVMHSMRGGNNANAVAYVALDTLAKPCNALFFMASGALLLPVKTSAREFLKRRLGKIIGPCLIWTIVYNLTEVMWRKQSVSDMLSLLVNVPFSDKAYGILWFVYVLIGLYILAPIISPWINTTDRREVKHLLHLWGVTLLLIIARNYVKFPADERHMLYYFGGYAGYFLLGYYVHKYRPRISSALLILMVTLPFAVALLLRTSPFMAVDRWSVLGYLSLFTALSSLGWFSFVQKVTSSSFLITDNRNQKKTFVRSMIVKISNLTFGVYLIHIIVRNALWQFPFVISHGCIIELSLTISLSFLISLSLAWGISKLPYAQYIIGYKKIK